MALRQVTLRHNFLTSNLGAIQVVGTVKSDPSSSGSFLLNTESINGKSIHLPVRIWSRIKQKWLIDSKLSITGTAVGSKEPKAAGLIFAKTITLMREPKFIFAKTEGIRSRFRDEAKRISGDGGALIPGLVIGDTSLESSQFMVKMRRVGLTHLTAVSGENFAIIATFLTILLRRIIPRLKLRLLITAIFLVLFIFLVRPSPSVARASVMAAISLIASAKGMRIKPTAALGAAVTLLILIDPFQATDPGFALSVGATAGIILLAPKLGVPEIIAIPLAATIICLPVIIAISGMLSLVTIPANLLAAPLVAPITILGFIAALAPPIAHPLLLLISPFAKALALIANTGSKFPVLLLPKSFTGAAIILILIFGFKRNYRKALLGLIPIFLIFTFINSRFPGKNWEVVNCDVGQGDGLALNLGDHSAIVIDVGPVDKKIDDCLINLGITKIPLLILTHFHADHVGGIAGAIRNRSVGQVWLTSYPAPYLEKEMTLKVLGNNREYFPTVGNKLGFKSPRGNVEINVLWPRQTFDTYQQLPGDGSSINNSSVALLITIDKLKIFATGDIEPPVQEQIFLNEKIGKVDILKVAHHGSAYQFEPLMREVSPRLAIISVGLGNNYGHPSPKTIALLESEGAKVMRTDLDGAISVDPSLSIRTAKSKWWDINWG
jgi:competence protein ComEC